MISRRLISLLLVLLSSALVISVTPNTSQADSPYPSWWSGDCDVNNHSGSHALGSSLNGVRACGPGPDSQGGYNKLVNFGAGTSEYEWQCVELSMRYMYLKYGITPYYLNENARSIVTDYQGSVLSPKSNNGNELPTPGDVLSEWNGNPNSSGHTAIVTAISVTNGSGTVTVLEQNGAANSNGTGTIAVTGNILGSNVTGWLHNPNYQSTDSFGLLSPILNTGGTMSIFGSRSSGGSAVYWQPYVGSSFTGSDTIGSSLATSPHVITASGGSMNLFAVNDSGQLVTHWQPTPGSSFVGPAVLGSGFEKVRPTALTNAGGLMSVFAIDTSGQLKTYWQTAPGSAFSGPAIIASGAAKKSPEAILANSGAMQVFFVDTSNNLWTYWQPAPGNSFSGSAVVAGGAGSAVRAIKTSGAG